MQVFFQKAIFGSGSLVIINKPMEHEMVILSGADMRKIGEFGDLADMLIDLRQMEKEHREKKDCSFCANVIKNQNNLLQIVLDIFPFAIGIVDAEKRWVGLNSKARKYAAIPNDIQRADLSEYFQVYTLDNKVFPSEDLPLVRALQGISTDTTVPMVIKPHNGAQTTVFVLSYPLVFSDGTLAGAILIFSSDEEMINGLGQR